MAGLRQLRPVTYYYNSSYAPNIPDLQLGFIAEEVAGVDTKLAIYENGIIENVDYPKMTVLLTKALQELDVQVQTQETRLSVLESGTFSGNLSVSVDAFIGDDLVVADDTTVQGNLTVQGLTEVADIKVNGKIITAGNTPTATLGASTTVGQGSTVSVEGNDTAGSITYTAGTVNLPTYNIASGAQSTLALMRLTVPYLE